MSRLHSHGLQLDPERTLDRLADPRIIEAEKNREMPDGGDAAEPHGASRPPLVPLVNLPDGLPLNAPIKSQTDFVLVSKHPTQRGALPMGHQVTRRNEAQDKFLEIYASVKASTISRHNSIRRTTPVWHHHQPTLHSSNLQHLGVPAARPSAQPSRRRTTRRR